MIKIKVIVFFLVIMLSYVCHAQSTKAIVHINQPFYVTGETIWYHISLPNNFSEFEGKAKVLVKNTSNEVVADNFIELKDLSLNGYFKIPFNFSHDLYNFSIYVLEKSTKRAIQLLNFDIPIYSDLSEQAITTIFPKAESRNKNGVNDNDQLELDIQLEKEAYTIGELINLKAQVVDDKGNNIPCDYSLSVIDQNLFSSTINRNCVFSTDINLDFNTEIHLDEKLFIQGKITNAETTEPIKVNIIGAYRSLSNKVDLGKSGTAGTFTIMVPEIKGDQKLQVVGYLFDEFEDTQVEMFQGDPLKRTMAGTNEYDQVIEDYLSASSMRKRIYQQFKVLESNAEYETVKNTFHFVEPNRVFKMAEYFEFETVGAFFAEIISAQLSFEKVGDVYKAKIFDPESNRSKSAYQDFYYKIDPIFIVDGKMTKNADFIHKLSLDQIDRVELYYNKNDIKEQYTIFGEFGYVIVHTKNGDLSLPKPDEEDILSFQAFLPKPKYPITTKTDNTGLPNLRPSLYWHPKLSSENGTLQTSFRASDDVSQFNIMVVARTKEGVILTREATISTVFSN